MKYAIFSVILLACGCSLEVRGRSKLPAVSTPGSMHDGTANGDSPDGGDSSPGIDKDSGTSSGHDAGGSAASDGGSPPAMDAGGATDTDAGNPSGNDVDSGETGSVTDAGDTSGGFTPAAGEVGAPCTANGECKGLNSTCAKSVDGSGMSGGSVAIPNGYCTHFCLGNANCGANESCQKNACLRTCKTNDDCRIDDGFTCRDKLCKLPGT